MNYVIPVDNQLSYHAIPRNKDLGYQIVNHCNYPSKTLVIDWRGNCFVCACEAWLPITVGKITDFDNLEKVWSGSVAQSLQDDINQKKFTNCAVDRCGILRENKLEKTFYISINIDESCNLKCPSCRRDKIMLSSGEEFETKLSQVNHVVDLLEKFDHACHIVMTGNGDPLASHIMRPLIHRYRPKHNHTIRLFTNGLLLEKQLPDSTIINNITQYFISIDAGSADVYEKVRLGGKFDQLLKNFDFLRSLVDRTGSEVLLKFVLQKDNWADMENFISLCQHYQFRGVINRLEDWGTWDQFLDHDVIGNSQHTEHESAVAELKRIYNLYHTVIQFNSSLIDIAKK